jgi:peptidoglycan/xylan/chitin deacetylase (PgdA/CDA1 family)
VRRLFAERGLTLTVYAVGMAPERSPAAGHAMVDSRFEVASHGWRWIDYHDVPEAEEREHIKLAIRAIERTTGDATIRSFSLEDDRVVVVDRIRRIHLTRPATRVESGAGSHWRAETGTQAAGCGDR